MCQTCDETRPDPTPNLDRMREVLGFLLSHPENHDQSEWFHTNCKTTGCVAGWTTHFSGRIPVRTSPYTNSYETVTLLPEETEETLISRYAVLSREHYEPTLNYLHAMAEWQRKYDKAKSEWTRITAEREAQRGAGVAFEDLTPYPPHSDSPDNIHWNKPEPEYTSAPTPCISIEDAGMIDLGISRRMANFLFSGIRTIGSITITLGMFLAGQSEEKISAYWGWDLPTGDNGDGNDDDN